MAIIVHNPNTSENVPFDPGCYADGAFGYGHVQDTTITLARQIAPAYLAERLYLQDGEDENDPEVWIEMAQEAIDILNAATTGGYWSFEDGNLMLRDENDPEGDA